MKKILGTILIVISLANYAAAQKLYVWCQKEQIPTPRNGFLQEEEIDLVIFDGRTLTSKSKIECESEVIIQNLADYVKVTYPAAKINILKSDQYYDKPKDNTLTIKIAISAYHAAFGANVKVGIGSFGGNFGWGSIPEGKWNAVTGYAVKIYNYTNESKTKYSKEIGKIASKPNMGGYSTAKKILNTTYIDANQELLFFIDDSLME